MLTRITCLFAAALLAACSDGNNHPPVVGPALAPLEESVALTSGPILGQGSERADTWEWLGVPYAAAPVGELRWKAPREVTSWTDTRAAQALPPECPQFDFFGQYVGQEDCLYLNVWRPRSQERDLPVMVWIHGGGNNSGATNWPLYNGAKLASEANIVVVTIQYRLGPLGWLYYAPLQDGDSDDNSGNFGTLDIIAALRWVQDNIAAFGGDPGNVTADGESAGGADILSLMLIQQASGLFQKAIVQSAGGSVTATDKAADAAARLVEELMALEGVTERPRTDAEMAAYLRGKSAQEIISNNPGTPAIFGDGHVIPAAGYELFESGEFPGKVPLLIGTNKDEFKLYTNPLGYNVLPGASEELRAVVGRYVSDLWRVTGADSIATRLRALDDYPDIYVYRFNWGSPNADGKSPLPLNFGPTGGAHHASEIPFMFGNWDTFLLDQFKDLLFTEDNAASREAISGVMVDYWGSFIRQGDPNGGSQPPWSPWSNAENGFKAIVLDVNYDDNQPLIGEDYSAWTVESVLAEVQANVVEPLLSELMPYLERWLGD
ncbi:MAG: carboxylesterase family protein [Gammaproteobacteria bacterium]|nr:carboxylesterase family protein [Gammaproteobacteria bacterium]MDH5171747.1 carboxylesterase family protein [Gammaproteobacteria bacterium]